MKHLLNEMSEEEKNSIRGQHTGGKNIDTTKFKKLMESKLGNAKPLISEQGIESTPSMDDKAIATKMAEIKGELTIDCNKKLITSSTLPKLDIEGNMKIIELFCKSKMK